MPQAFVGLQKRFLSQIVGRGSVSPGEVAEKSAHRRLMPQDQIAISIAIVVDDNTGDEISVRQAHNLGGRLGASSCLGGNTTLIRALMRSATPMKPGTAEKPGKTKICSE